MGHGSWVEFGFEDMGLGFCVLGLWFFGLGFGFSF